jgi:hypothetical protein
MKALLLLLWMAQASAAEFPLVLKLPADFRDVTAFVGHGQARGDSKVYCNEADAQLQRAQLQGQRIYERMQRGCFVVEVDPSTSYDGKRFSVEKDIAAQGNFKSTSPQLELRTFVVSRQTIKGLPGLRLTQEARSHYGRERFQFLYLAAPGGVWLVRYVEAGDEKRSAAIWDAFLKGL